MIHAQAVRQQMCLLVLVSMRASNAIDDHRYDQENRARGTEGICCLKRRNRLRQAADSKRGLHSSCFLSTGERQYTLLHIMSDGVV